ncbi:MAG: CYTH domain-containing protein [Streptosporangiales bacterium]|nr:CYTH domain-containing protein [Streptosporangiales bacterium]
MSEHLEIEQKFEVGEDFRRPDFGGVGDGVTAGDPVTHHLSATYYDTRDQRLAGAKITLRRRTGGTDEGWHMKLPVSGDTRRELREPLSDELPGALAARAAEVTGGIPVEPIARLDTERIVVTLHHEGRAAAEVADDTVTARRLDAAGDGTTLRWREIEVEVAEAGSPAGEAAARLLAEAGARPARSASKLGRLLGR